MALTNWKQFKFFDSSQISFLDSQDSEVFTQSNASSICSGSETLFVGGFDGIIRAISPAFKVSQSFVAYENIPVTHIRVVEHLNLLVTVAEDLSSDPELKVWSLNKLDKKTGGPKSLSTVSVQNGRRLFPISAFAVLDDLSQVAIGFGNGAITIIRGDLVHDRGTKQRTVFESEEPITGLEFRSGNSTALYIATTARILTLALSGRGSGQPARTLDDKGCAVGCVDIDRHTGDAIIARDDGVARYGPHGRGSRFNVDGQKTLLACFNDYLVLAYPAASSAHTRSTMVRFNDKQNVERDQVYSLTILHPDFQIIAHIQSISEPIRTAFSAWSALYVLTTEGNLHRFHEKPLEQRLDLLYQRNQYVLAIQMAKKAGANEEQQSSIFRRYGDHLYQKRDYDTAMQQYLRAIDSTEPSQVIRKYLGTQRINNLLEYLEELHEQGKATSDHTILLLSCYAKLKDVNKLETFIKGPGASKFDVDTAISMCRQGGYFDQAAYLARRHSQHDLVISILVEDLHKYAEALAYIWRLEPALAFSNATKYANVFVEHCGDDATTFFIEYFTGQFRPKQDAVFVTSVAKQPEQPTGITSSAVQSLASIIPLPYMNITNHDKTDSSDHRTETHVVEAINDQPGPEYEIPNPRQAFSAFVDHPKEFVKFLETCISSGKVNNEYKPDLYTTLFEIYLQQSNASKGEEREQWRAKARQLIEGQQVSIDASNVLLLSDLSHFEDGITLIKEQQGLRFDIFRNYTSAKDTAGAIRALKRYGPLEPQLYPAALAYFTSSSEILQEAGSEVEAVLKKIKDARLMAPLQVIQTLSKNDVAAMGLVKDYLRNIIGTEKDEIENNQKAIETFRDDTATKRSEYTALTSKPVQFTAKRCQSCGFPLDNPTVHFFCKHSYHERCLNVEEGQDMSNVECPTCAPQNATVRLIKKSQEDYRFKHDLFKEQLERSNDGFTTVAEWFARGVMNVGTGE